MPFIHPAFLWSLAALAVPLWLHLSRKRQYKEMSVGSLRFLQEVLRERRKRSRFEEIPLLLLRLLAVVLLAFLFMRPFLKSRQSAPDQSSETILLLDASGSMTPDMLAEAISLAKKAQGRVREGEKLTLAQFSDEVAILPDLQAYQPRAGAPTNLTAAMNWALDRFGNLAPDTTGRIMLIGHLASHDLPQVPPRVWPPGIRVEVLPVEQPSVDNASVRSVALRTPYATENMEIEVAVNLPRGTSREVKLEAEGLTEKATVPMGSERVLFKFRPPRDEIRGWISVAGGDAWPADDRRPFAVKWVQPRRILLVDGLPGSTPFEGQGYFAEKALTSSGAAHGKTPFKPEIRFGLEGRQGSADLTGISTVGLFGMTEPTAAEARLLVDFVEKGGGVLSVLDARYEAASGRELQKAGLLPDSLARTDGDALAAVATWDKTHPILANFDGKDGGDLRELDWRNAFDMQPAVGWKPLASFAGGNALLMEKTPAKITDGKVLVLAHSLTREWGDLPRMALFVPLVKNLFTYLSQAETARPELLPLLPGMKETRPPGVYTSPAGQTEVVAADAGESAISPATEAALRSSFGIPTPTEGELVAAPTEVPDSLATASVPWRRELWPWIALGLLVLLTFENLLATRKPKLPVS